MSEGEAMEAAANQAIGAEVAARQQSEEAFQAVWCDITERKRAEEALRGAALQWQATFDAVGDAVFLLDADQRIRRVNRAAETLLGKPAAEMEGRFCHDVVHDTARPILDCPFLRLCKSLRREELELAMDDRCFNVTLDPVRDAKGRLAGAVHIISDVTVRKHAEAELARHREHLEDLVDKRTALLEKANADLRAEIGERKQLEEYLLTIAEKTQQGIAQDLHDDVGQELTGLGLKAETLAEMLAVGDGPAGNGAPSGSAAKLAADVAASVERARGKLRGLSRSLLPPELEEGLLAAALERLAITTTTGSRIACTLACPRPDLVFDGRVVMHLYRIAQEAVSNAVRHSRAENIRITLEQESGVTTLKVEDDGIGLAHDDLQAPGMGLRTMRYRAGLIGGELVVIPGPGAPGAATRDNGLALWVAGQGTQIVCRAPVHKDFAPRPSRAGGKTRAAKRKRRR